MKVREIQPQRRLSPGKSEKGNDYQKHKPELKEDFHSCCGYCGAYDGFGHASTYFEIDHFVPKDYLTRSESTISLCKYSNLVYSCRSCNNNKTKHWPSQRDDVYVIRDTGFIEPCDPEYENHLYRTDEGAIMWNTPIGKWMATTAFKFDERMEEVKLLWKYNKIRITIDELIIELNSYLEGSDEYEEIRKRISPLYERYYFLQKALRDS